MNGVTSFRRPKNSVPARCLLLTCGDVITGMKINPLGVVRSPPVQIIEPPKRRSKSIAHVLSSAIEEVVGFLQPVRQSATRHLWRKQSVQVLIRLLKVGRKEQVTACGCVLYFPTAAAWIRMLRDPSHAPRGAEIIGKPARPFRLSGSCAGAAELHPRTMR